MASLEHELLPGDDLFARLIGSSLPTVIQRGRYRDLDDDQGDLDDWLAVLHTRRFKRTGLFYSLTIPHSTSNRVMKINGINTLFH